MLNGVLNGVLEPNYFGSEEDEGEVMVQAGSPLGLHSGSSGAARSSGSVEFVIDTGSPPYSEAAVETETEEVKSEAAQPEEGGDVDEDGDFIMKTHEVASKASGSKRRTWTLSYEEEEARGKGLRRRTIFAIHRLERNISRS